MPVGSQVQSPPREGLIVVGLEGAVDPANAPRPRNRAERLVFSQVYETLVRVDCEGRVVPGLAESWIRQPRGDEWLFTLRGDARFHDGAPVTARDVVES
ncbi:MAG: ABC transporter substrate-binding protein, partial [Longimicrobiales bacterium]